jgi:hypothetical protein
MFELVSPYQLKFNQNYKIVADRIYKGNYSGLFYCDHGNLYLLFDRVYDMTKEKHSPPIFCLFTSTYYRFVTDNPQWNMERRSVNMIIRQLIGDDHFEW